MDPYLSICSIYRDHAEYLAEWIEFHRLVGVERFFLYDNLSRDHHREVLEPYVEAGVVVQNDWHRPFFPTSEGMLKAYEHCLEHHGENSRWIAFIDIDEFLFSPTGRPVSDLLVEYERFPGVAVNWATFGTSGHRTKPRGLVIESYLGRSNREYINRNFKSVVDPSRVARTGNPHFFIYRKGWAVDENKRPLGPIVHGQFRRGKTQSVSSSRLRINHYWSKSEEECRKKLELWQGTGGPEAGRARSWAFFEEFNAKLNDERDETILMYLPQLKAALEKAEPAAVTAP
jgi:hypothetical protein